MNHEPASEKQNESEAELVTSQEHNQAPMQSNTEAEERVLEHSEEVEEQEEPTEQKPSFARSAFEFLEMFAFSVFAVLIIFTFCIRLCRVDGSSMENTLHTKEALLLSNIAYTPEQDDIIVFHITNEQDNMEKTMVKRVIATGGQELVIDFNTGIITVDGVVYEDSHRILKDLNGHTLDYYTLYANHHYNMATNILTATVPEGYVFVMGDNRNNSKDSRNSDVGFVDERCVLGKVILRLSPFTRFD